mmetsp:Transcript_46110/g.53187  ORF Transcript_46110/g.53187 Transcript_46110/m.53187 type:complete len:119 (-) Transcript_46110:84-440(-)
MRMNSLPKTKMNKTKFIMSTCDATTSSTGHSFRHEKHLWNMQTQTCNFSGGENLDRNTDSLSACTENKDRRLRIASPDESKQLLPTRADDGLNWFSKSVNLLHSSWSLDFFLPFIFET